VTDATDAMLAAQYEQYPYPRRDPRDESRRLLVGSPSHVREIDHWVFGASRPAETPLRALFAGGGSGDGAVMLAQQLASAGRPGHVTWLDRSGAARSVAEARAEVRGLKNIGFVQGSLLDLPGACPGSFDYIDCCGVLHHLPDPAEGLRCLLSVLAPGGGLGLMVYAPHGRTGVYMAQDALALLAPAAEDPAMRLDAARRVMRHLPATHWLRQNPNFTDHLSGGDAGLYDLLLNPRDRAFTVAAFHRLLKAAGLRVTCWVEPMRYDPAVLLPDPKLRARIASLSALDQASLAEALACNMPTHIVYCVREGNTVALPDHRNPQAVPVARELPMAELAERIRGDGMLPWQFDALRIDVPLPPLAPAILKRIDGTRTVSQIASAFPAAGFAKAWDQLYGALNALNRLLIRAP
jgi:SAM-dependent methyltransferase